MVFVNPVTITVFPVAIHIHFVPYESLALKNQNQTSLDNLLTLAVESHQITVVDLDRFLGFLQKPAFKS